MTWKIHYSVPFASRHGRSYIVNVYEWDYAGDVVTLTGASEPFVTQEDDSNDIFTPIRTQTGYLRIIDTTGGTLLEEMMPKNNTEKPIRLLCGQEVCWQGFLSAQAYSQPWDNHKNQIDFQVNSLLATLEYITVPTTYTGETSALSRLLPEAIKTLSRGDSSALSADHYIIHDLVNSSKMLEDCWLDFSAFVDKEEVTNEGSTVKVRVGDTYKECLEGVCALYGVSLRECGNRIYYSRYDEGSAVLRYHLIGQSIGGGLGTGDMLDTISFQSAQNSTSYIQGAKVVKVSLSLPSQDSSFGIPSVETNDDEPSIIKLVCGNLLYVQQHAAVNTDELKYAYHLYNWRSLAYAEDTSADAFYSKTIVNGYVADPYSNLSKSNDLVTGGMPVRFYHQQDNTDIVTLVDGVYFNAQYQNVGSNMGTPVYSPASLDNVKTRPILTFNSVNAVSMKNGYIRVNFSLLNIFKGRNNVIGTLMTYDTYTDGECSYVYNLLNSTQSTYNVGMKLTVALMAAGKYWDAQDEGWSTDEKTFELEYKDGAVVSNYDKSMQLESTDGFFVPISGVSSPITFIVYDRCVAQDIMYESSCYSHIIYSLEVEYLEIKNVTVGENTSNIYRRELTDGFSDTKEISLTIGTKNNNEELPVFVKNAIHEDISRLDYLNVGGNREERPEVRLLNRMANYYGQVRRTLTATIRDGLDLMLSRYKYAGRLFFGIDSQHNWRDDTQEVKFIEAQEATDAAEQATVDVTCTITIPSIDSVFITEVTFTGSRQDISEHFDETMFNVCDWTFLWSNTDVNHTFAVDEIISVSFSSAELGCDGVAASAKCVSSVLYDEAESLYMFKFEKYAS